MFTKCLAAARQQARRLRRAVSMVELSFTICMLQVMELGLREVEEVDGGITARTVRAKIKTKVNMFELRVWLGLLYPWLSQRLLSDYQVGNPERRY